jgi:hypothetical protein
MWRRHSRSLYCCLGSMPRGRRQARVKGRGCARHHSTSELGCVGGRSTRQVLAFCCMQQAGHENAEVIRGRQVSAEGPPEAEAIRRLPRTHVAGTGQPAPRVYLPSAPPPVRFDFAYLPG